MSFVDEIKTWRAEQVTEWVETARADQVEQALATETLTLRDFAALLSPAACNYLEPLAQKAQRITRRRFGHTIQLYTPMYLSNECSNGCRYCGFNAGNPIPRTTLTLDEIEDEARIIHDHGFRAILLLTGEHGKLADNRYLVAAVKRIRALFSSISIEVYPMDVAGYRQMVNAGVDGLTLYQETYDSLLYEDLHPYGKKRDYNNRLDAPDRAGTAGLRRIGIGALLGLGRFATEAFYTGLHARYLSRRYWRSHICVSFPRIRPADGCFVPLNPVSDRQLAQLVCALRLLLPDAGLFLSTRESALLRDNFIPLGITHMSAGSSTAPGGHSRQETAGEQFSVDDRRSPEEICSVLHSKGFEVVWKDWDRAFLNVSAPLL